jgi:hypothetical protein
MNSFKKIALGVVAALSLSTIVATPASAAPMTVAITVNGSAPTNNGLSTTAAVALPVPSDNSVDATDALKFVATVDTGTAVTVSATNASIILATATSAAPVTASAGSASATIATGTGTTATFFVFTKTIAVGTVVITNQGTTTTYYVQGTAGNVNTVSVAGDDTAASGTQKTYTVTTTDVFGNKVTGVALTATVSNGTLDTVTATTGSGLTNFGTADFKVTMAASGNAVAIFGLGASVTAQSAIAGFATPVLTASKVVANRDLATELASMTAARDAANAALAAEKAASAKALADAKLLADAELIKVKAELAKANADSVTAKVAADKAIADATAELAKVKADNAAALAALKKSFNALATKWNKKNPKAKVTLVK